MRMPQLGNELARLNQLHTQARSAPAAWAVYQHAHPELATWLFGIALGVLAQGLPESARALLDILPGVDVGQGRRNLLNHLITLQALQPAQQDTHA